MKLAISQRRAGSGVSRRPAPHMPAVDPDAIDLDRVVHDVDYREAVKAALRRLRDRRPDDAAA